MSFIAENRRGQGKEDCARNLPVTSSNRPIIISTISCQPKGKTYPRLGARSPMSHGRPPHETKWPGCEGVPVPCLLLTFLPTKFSGDVQRCRDQVFASIRLDSSRSMLPVPNLENIPSRVQGRRVGCRCAWRNEFRDRQVKFEIYETRKK